MKQTFTVDGLHYELSVSRANDIRMAIVGGASPTYQPEDDPFDWDYVPYITADIGTTRFPVTVLRKARYFVYDWIGNTRPPFFSLSAETGKRYRLYRRMAAKLVERFPYNLTETGSSFYFYRRL